MSVPTLFADSKIGLTKRLMELTGFGCVGIKLGKCKVTLIIGPLSHKRSYKITVVCLSVFLSIYLSVCLPACLPACLPVCLSVCLSFYSSVSLEFLSGMADYFFLTFGTVLDHWNIYKLAEPFFSKANHFCPNLGNFFAKISPILGFFRFYEKFYH